jgi:ketosteroid isomerase-like protein
LVSVFSVTVGCEDQESLADLEAVKAHAEAAVRQAEETWGRAIAAKSVEQTVAVYDPEAVTAGSAMFPARGLEEFRVNWAKQFGRPDFALSWKVEKVTVIESGTIACTTGTWRSPAPQASGPYLAVWRKQVDGQWKLLIDAAWYSAPR